MQNPENITEIAKKIVLDLLPVKSRQIYEKELIRWKEMNNIVIVDEDAMLNYLHKKSKEVKPSTLWSKYSMIKSVLSVKENIEINTFARVIAFLKRNSTGYEPTKSKVLTRHEINTFLTKANDEKFLLIKVALLIGVCGACRREELHSLKIQDIVQKDAGCLLITIPDMKSNIKRVFPVVAAAESVNYLELYQKYVRLRPAKVEHDYFFISYRKGKCTVQRVAEFLKLPNPTEYTGHCFRRSSASLAADGDVDLISLKRLGGWKSSSVAKSYIEESIEKKKKVCRMLLGEKKTEPSSNIISVTSKATTTTSKEINTISSGSGVSFGNNSFEGAQNCSFHLHLGK